MQKWMAPLERAGKIDQNNGMVRYDPMKTSPYMKDWKLMKSEKVLNQQNKCSFLVCKSW